MTTCELLVRPKSILERATAAIRLPDAVVSARRLVNDLELAALRATLAIKTLCSMLLALDVPYQNICAILITPCSYAQTWR